MKLKTRSAIYAISILAIVLVNFLIDNKIVDIIVEAGLLIIFIGIYFDKEYRAQNFLLKKDYVPLIAIAMLILVLVLKYIVFA